MHISLIGFGKNSLAAQDIFLHIDMDPGPSSTEAAAWNGPVGFYCLLYDPRFEYLRTSRSLHNQPDPTVGDRWMVVIGCSCSLLNLWSIFLGHAAVFHRDLILFDPLVPGWPLWSPLTDASWLRYSKPRLLKLFCNHEGIELSAMWCQWSWGASGL